MTQLSQNYDELDAIAVELWEDSNINFEKTSKAFGKDKKSKNMNNKNDISDFNNKPIHDNNNNRSFNEKVIFNFNENNKNEKSVNKKVSLDNNNNSKQKLLSNMRNQMNMLNKNSNLPSKINKSMSVSHLNDNKMINNFQDDDNCSRNNEFNNKVSKKDNSKPAKLNENKNNKNKGKGNNGYDKKNGQNESKSVKDPKSNNKIEIVTFQLISPYKFTFESTFFPTSEYMKLCKDYGQFDYNRKVWEINFNKYPQFLEGVNKIVNEENEVNKLRKIVVKEIPSFVLKCKLKESLNSEMQEIKAIFNINKQQIRIHVDYKMDFLNKYSLERIEPKFLEKLFNFQKEGIKFAIERKGRILLADEMGVGKTIQAICIAKVYDDSWPVLVLCPSSLKFNWRNEIMRWTILDKKDIQVVMKGNEVILNNKQKFCIISYDIASNDNKSQEIDKLNFQCILVDEAHALKNHETKRCKNLLPIIKKTKRLVLMSGTPILSRPVEIFTLISSIRPDLFNNFHSFAHRYCGPKETFHGLDFTGTSNLRELNFLLENFMIRRLKKDVLNELPDKFRQRIEVPVDEKLQNMIAALKNKNTEKFQHYYNQINEQMFSNKNNELNPEGEKEIDDSPISLYNKAYKITGLAKIDGINNYVNYLLEEDQKFLVFAHHTEILDKLEECVLNFKKKHKGFNYIRIDGKTPSNKRQDLVDNFQQDDTYKVAILSITACSTGLTLTQASIVVFAELFFTPSIMIQAEDRVHRHGQKNSVQVKYLVGHKTLDDDIFEALNFKCGIVSETLDDCRKDLEVKKFGKLNYNDDEDHHIPSLNIKKNPRYSEEIISVKVRKIVKSVSKEDIDLSYSKIPSKEKAKLKGQKRLDEFLKIDNNNRCSLINENSSLSKNKECINISNVDEDYLESAINELDSTIKLNRTDLEKSSGEHTLSGRDKENRKSYLKSKEIDINSLDYEIMELFDEDLISQNY